METEWTRLLLGFVMAIFQNINGSNQSIQRVVRDSGIHIYGADVGPLILSRMCLYAPIYLSYTYSVCVGIEVENSVGLLDAISVSVDSPARKTHFYFDF